MITPIRTLAMAAVATTALLFGATDGAEAGDFRIGVRVGSHSGSYHGPRHPGHHGRHARPSHRRHHYGGHAAYRHRPVVVHRRYVPGHYVTRTEQVKVRIGRWARQWVPPVYETHYDRYGRPHQVLVRKGFHTKVWIPAVFETRYRRVWIPGHYD